MSSSHRTLLAWNTAVISEGLRGREGIMNRSGAQGFLLELLLALEILCIRKKSSKLNYFSYRTVKPNLF